MDPNGAGGRAILRCPSRDCWGTSGRSGCCCSASTFPTDAGLRHRRAESHEFARGDPHGRAVYSAERVLNDLSEEARQFTETGPLLETVTNRVAATLHIPKACVLVRDGESYCLANAASEFDPSVRCLPSHARSVEHVRQSRKPALIYFDDGNSWVQQIKPEEKRQLQAFDVQVLLPLSGREDLAGVMVLGPKLSEEPYSGADLRLLQSVASRRRGLRSRTAYCWPVCRPKPPDGNASIATLRSPVRSSSACFRKAVRRLKDRRYLGKGRCRCPAHVEPAGFIARPDPGRGIRPLGADTQYQPDDVRGVVV
jgi:hypothetical protein